jgi:hypothetical protein
MVGILDVDTDIKACICSEIQHLQTSTPPPAAAAVMASTTNALILGDKAEEIFNPTSKIAGNYKNVYVNNAQLPYSFYVVYSDEHYGTNDKGESTLVPSEQVLSTQKGDFSETITLKYAVRSAQGYDIQDPGICLFQHGSYKGSTRMFRASENNLQDTFGGPNAAQGVSSLIVTGGTWNLYGTVDFKPPLLATVKKGEFLPSLPYNDKVQSVEKIAD